MYCLYRLTLEATHRGRPGAEISPQPVHSASSVRHCRLHRSTGWTQNTRTCMTQRNSYTAWPGLRRLNRLPSETVLGRLQRWPLPDHWKPSGPGLVPTQPMPHSARWTYAVPHFRDESSTRRNTGKTTLNEVAVTSHNVNWPLGPAETWPPKKITFTTLLLLLLFTR